MPDTIWIARHANRQDFADPDWAATAERPHDPGLSPDGVEQARKLARRMAEAPIGHIFASPFLRAVQTAHHVADLREQPVYLEPGLGEWLNADWFASAPEIKPAEQLARTYEHVDLSHTPCGEPTFPEAKDEMFARIGRAARCLVDRHTSADGGLLIVGHGATVTGVLLGLVEGAEETGCPLCSVTKLVHDDDRWSIAVRNDTTHLDRPEAADRFN